VLPDGPEGLSRSAVTHLRRGAGEGAGLFAALAGGLAVLGLVCALVVTDGLHARIGLLFGFPVAGFSFGAVLLDAAMGAALGGVAGHTSLAHFGMPAGPGAGAAPIWLFAAVLLAPGAVAMTVWRRLERERPVEEQGALAVGAATGLGFAVAAWVAALVGRIVLLAAVTGPGGDVFPGAPRIVPVPTRATVGTLVALRPNPAAVLGLGLLWGLAGGLGAAFLWASRRNARWQITGAGGPPGATPPPPPPAAVPPPAAAPAPGPPPRPPAAPAASPPGATPPEPPAGAPTAWLLPEEGRPTETGQAGAEEEPPEEKP
jgi:hypothetical protein